MPSTRKTKLARLRTMRQRLADYAIDLPFQMPPTVPATNALARCQDEFNDWRRTWILPIIDELIADMERRHAARNTAQQQRRQR